MTNLRDGKMLADGKPPATTGTADTAHALTRVMALHAVAYCERLFYLEEIEEIDEVEEIRIADERVYAGRILHQTLPDDQPLTAYVRESERLGIRGKFDALKRQDVAWWWCSTNAGGRARPPNPSHDQARGGRPAGPRGRSRRSP